MKKINATSHARTRMQQRAINAMQIRLIEVFGRTQYQKGGANVGYMPEKTLTELRHAIDKLANVQILLGEQDRIITAMHETRRIHKTQYAA